MKSNNHYVMLALLAFFLSMFTADSKETDSKSALDRDRRKEINVFFELLAGMKAPSPEVEKKLSLGLSDVKSCLMVSKAYKNEPTPISLFIRNIGKNIINNNERLSEILVYGPTDANNLITINNNSSRKNSYVATANLKKDSVDPPMLIIFFQFVPDSTLLFIAPVIAKSNSVTSLYDFAYRERD